MFLFYLNETYPHLSVVFVFLLTCSSPHTYYGCIFALLWLFSVHPTFYDTIGHLYTMPACYSANHFSVIIFSKYENNRKTTPKPGHKSWTGRVWKKKTYSQSTVILKCDPGAQNPPRLIGNTVSTYISAKLKNLPICTIPCSFQLKWTLEAVKLWQLLFLFTRSMTYRNSFDYFLTVTCRMVCYGFKRILTSCTIWKLILLNVVVTYTASYVWVY